MRWTRWTALAASLAVAVVAVATWSCAKPAQNTPAPITQEQKVARGEYLTTIMGCNDCHTPFKVGASGPEPDMSRMLSGHPETLKLTSKPMPSGEWVWAGAGTNTAFHGPWGTTYAPNLTPDRVTGLGVWPEETFVKAMRTGRHYGVARPILPPMPWQAVGQATNEDLKSIYAYLQSIKPIRNQVPDYEPPSPAPKSSGKS